MTWCCMRGGWAVAAVSLAALACSPKGAPPTAAPETGEAPVDEAALPPPGSRLPEWVRPERYALELSIDPRSATFDGRVVISVRLTSTASVVLLHGQDLEVHSAGVTQGTNRWSATVEPREGAGGRSELVLRPERPLTKGRAKLVIEYSGRQGPLQRGLLSTVVGSESYVYSHFEPASARRAFPSFDSPGLKAPVKLSVTAPRGLQVLANAPLEKRTPSSDGQWETHRFRETPPLPTYAVALAVGRFDEQSDESGPVPVRVLAPRGDPRPLDQALQAARRQLEAAIAVVGMDYPFSKMDLLSVPTLPFGIAMEHPGLVTVHQDYVPRDERCATWLESERDRVIAHEFAHMWFGNLVTPQWWDDIWVSEGLATWLEGEICDRAGTACSGAATRSHQKAYVMQRDLPPLAQPVRLNVRTAEQASAAFNAFAYFKGMSLIEMLSQYLGRDDLLDGLRGLVAAHPWGSVTTLDLVDALEQASGRQVRGILDGFLHQTGVPRVTFELECGTDGTRPPKRPTLHVAQHEYQPDPGQGSSQKQWQIPLCVRFDADGKVRDQCWLFDARERELGLPTTSCPSFVYPNANDAGYYYFSVDDRWFASVVAQRSRLTETERVGLGANLWALVLDGGLDIAQYLELVRAFAEESSPRVWDQILPALAQIERWLPPSVRPAFALYTRQLVSAGATELGWTALPIDSRDQRELRGQLLLAWGTRGGAPEPAAASDPVAERWRAAPLRVDADLAEAALAVRAAAGDARLVEPLFEQARSAPGPDRRRSALNALGSFADAALMARVLDRTLTNQLPVPSVGSIYRAAAARTVTRDLAADWIEKNYDRIGKERPAVLGSTSWIVEALCDAESIARMERTFGLAAEGTPAVRAALTGAANRARRCVTLAARHGPAAAAYLQRLPAP